MVSLRWCTLMLMNENLNMSQNMFFVTQNITLQTIVNMFVWFESVKGTFSGMKIQRGFYNN